MKLVELMLEVWLARHAEQSDGVPVTITVIADGVTKTVVVYGAHMDALLELEALGNGAEVDELLEYSDVVEKPPVLSLFVEEVLKGRDDAGGAVGRGTEKDEFEV